MKKKENAGQKEIKRKIRGEKRKKINNGKERKLNRGRRERKKENGVKDI